MQLKNILPHKKNTRVLVNGTIYFIGPDNIICDDKTNKPVDVPKEDAQRLLNNDQVWKVWDGKAPKKEQPKPKEKSGGIQLLDGSGDVVTPPEPEVLEVEEEVQEEEGDPPIPGEDEDWPDPEESYSKEWLMACADAYGVSYRKNLSKAKLVERIKDAMYE